MRFYSTYEELKLIFCKATTDANNSFYSTYEELKLNIPQFVSTQVSVRFYSTYEELKQPGCRVQNDKPEVGFYSTYEELKQGGFIYGRNYSSSFYSTYEELKLKKPYTNTKASFTVPMRNWNLACLRKYYF